MTKPFIAAAIAALSLAATAPAMAAGSSESGYRIEYRDLDLSSDAGRAELHRRTDKVAREICAVRPRTGTLTAFESCRNDVRRQLTDKVAAATRANGAALALDTRN